MPKNERGGAENRWTSPGRGLDARALPGVARLPEPLRSIVARHDGVATTGQLVAGGMPVSVVTRRVRTGHWGRLHRGVVVLQSGPPTWRQLAHGAVLAAGDGAALSHRSAAFVHGLIHEHGQSFVVSVPAHRVVAARPGLVMRRRHAGPGAGGWRVDPQRPLVRGVRGAP